MKQSALAGLQADLAEINTKYQQLLTAPLKQLGNPDSLFYKDPLSLRQHLLPPAVLMQLGENQKVLQTLQDQLNAGKKIDTALYAQVKSQVLQVKGLQEVIATMEQHYQKWQSSGLLQKLQQWDVIQQQGVGQFLKDPSAITRLARQNLSLNSLQRLFLSITKLNMGENAANASPLSLEHLVNKGVLSEFVSQRNTFLAYLGKHADNFSLLD